MTKTNAERQRVYCERKKVKEGSKYLEKTPKRQKQYYKKTNELSTKELKERKETVKTGLTKTLLIAKTNL